MAKLQLHQFPSPPGLPVSASPYCARVEVYLRLAGREFVAVDSPDPRKSPTKEVPWVTLPGGDTMADSGSIIARLEKEGPALDEGLGDDERRRGEQLVERVDGPIYFSNLYARFGEPEGWGPHKKYLSGGFPWLLSWIVLPLIRSLQVKKCAANGYTSPADHQKAVEAIGEVERALGDKPFLLGDCPRVTDCAVWPQLVTCMHTTQSTPARDAARGSEALVTYVEAVAERAGLVLRSYRD